MILNHIKKFSLENRTYIIFVSLIMLSLLAYHCYLLLQFGCNSNKDNSELKERLEHYLSLLEVLTRRHSWFLAVVKQSPWLIDASAPRNLLSLVIPYKDGPTMEYEILRRRGHSYTKELWYYLSDQLNKALDEESDGQRKIIADSVEEVAERKRLLLSLQEQIPLFDGREKWRRKEAVAVSDLIQRRLVHLQNPADCRRAKKLVCPYEWQCGFGCDILYLASCLIQAYAMKRTLVLRNDTWVYNGIENNQGWEYVFQPVSVNCTQYHDEKYVIPGRVTKLRAKQAKVLYFPTTFYRHHYKTAIPIYYIPQDLARRIVRFTSDPASWWVGQMLKYLMKPQHHVRKAIAEALEEMDITPPIVGVQFRRTYGLVRKAGFHPLEEYMSKVEDYYKQLEQNVAVTVRRVYLATDDVDILKEAKRKYPDYKFYSNYSRALEAGSGSRYNMRALTGQLVDLYMLTTCDYTVTTLSSNVGRTINGLMHAHRRDVAKRFLSLDYINYFFRSEPVSCVAVMRNADIAFDIGDIIQVYRWNSTSDGTVLRTKIRGRIPLYKTEERLFLFRFPEYESVPIYTEEERKRKKEEETIDYGYYD